ncbi:hypothetical protein D3C76_939190 [compost metagenome]
MNRAVCTAVQEVYAEVPRESVVRNSVPAMRHSIHRSSYPCIVIHNDYDRSSIPTPAIIKYLFHCFCILFGQGLHISMPATSTTLCTKYQAFFHIYNRECAFLWK